MIESFKTIFIILFFFNSGCISFSLSKEQRKLAENISLSTPAKPFNEFNLNTADRAWQNQGNGNIISYMSSCDPTLDPTLEDLQAMAVEGIDKLKIIEQKKTIFNNREALNSTLTGRVDGVKIQTELTVLKKNNCISVYLIFC